MSLPTERETLLKRVDLIERWLRETQPEALERLWEAADGVRRQCVGDEVYLRAIIEISNFCVRRCAYCGIRGPNTRLQRYRMKVDEIVATAARALSAGIHTIVLQSGEDPALDAEWVAEVIRRIKSLGRVAITLSLGERSDEELTLWRNVGADRYLLRFETSNADLYRLYHPPRLDGRGRDRLDMLATLRRLDYEVGSGVMIGLPGQRWRDLARDLQLFAELDLDMVGCGPFILHPHTPLGDVNIAIQEGFLARICFGAGDSAMDGPSEVTAWATSPKDNMENASNPGFARSGEFGEKALYGENFLAWPPSAGPDQVPPDELTTYKVIALSRLLCPWANIPATTALATLNPAMGRRLGLRRGANIIMPNFTPGKYRRLYTIYPGKADKPELSDEPEAALEKVLAAIAAEGRTLGEGPGTSMNYLKRKGLL